MLFFLPEKARIELNNGIIIDLGPAPAKLTPEAGMCLKQAVDWLEMVNRV